MYEIAQEKLQLEQQVTGQEGNFRNKNPFINQKI